MEKWRIIAALESAIRWADLIYEQANEVIDVMNEYAKHKMPHMLQPTMDRQKQVLKEAKADLEEVKK